MLTSGTRHLMLSYASFHINIVAARTFYSERYTLRASCAKKNQLLYFSWKLKLVLASVKRAVILLQRIYRGYTVRCRVDRAGSADSKIKRISEMDGIVANASSVQSCEQNGDVYEVSAKTVQRVWRTYNSRKNETQKWQQYAIYTIKD